jgi:hypothetical protein
MTGERWEAWCSENYAGRDDLPGLLAELYYRQFERHDPGFREDLDEVAYALADAWSGPDHPTRAGLEVLSWTHMFERVGYVVDGRRAEAERPTGTVTLYRGAHPSFRRGMSWTDQLDVACWFTRYRSPGGSQVYVARVPPKSLLAHLHEYGNGRGEHEFVVDMRGVRTKVAPLTPAEVADGSARYVEGRNARTAQNADGK